MVGKMANQPTSDNYSGQFPDSVPLFDFARLIMKDAVKLLDQTLAEEKKTDDALTKLAATAVNAEAA